MPRPSFLFVTDAPLSLQSSSGFSVRCLHFVRALQSCGDVDVIGLTRSSDLDNGLSASDLGVRSVHRVATSPPLRGRADRVKRAADRLGSRWPSFSRGVGNRSIELLLREARVDVAILHLPHLVHLAQHVAATTPIVFVLEEAWEKVHRADLVQPTPVQRGGLLLDRWRTDRLYRFAARSGALLTAISAAEAKHFRALTGRDDITVIPHGVDTTYFQPSDGDKTADVVIVGDMRQRRNFLPTIDLLGVAEDRGTPIKWNIVGPTKSEPHASPQVRWHGFVPDVRPFYWTSRVAVVTQTEGTGVKGTLLQAWASGVPVVASTYSAQSAAAIDGEDVLVADSPDAVLDCVQRILHDQPTARRLAANGLARARALDIRRIADRFAADVHRLIP